MRARGSTYLFLAVALAVSACSTGPAGQRPRASAPTTIDDGDVSGASNAAHSVARGDLLPEQTVIPLVRRKDMLFVRAAIDGRDAGEFLLDTGATSTAIDEDLADQLGLSEIAQTSIAGIHMQSTVSLRRLSHLSIGGVEVASEPTVAMALDDVSRYVGTRVGGIIGFPTLGPVPFTIDFRAATLTLYNPARFVPPATEPTLLRVYNNAPYVTATLEDGSEAFLLLDTGANVPMVLWRPFVDLVPGVLTVPQKRWATTIGAGGGTQVVESELRYLRVFGHDVRGLTVTIQPPPATAWKHTRAAGLLGVPMLRDQRITVHGGWHQVWAEGP